jgi:hypothetical protein
MMMKSSGKRAPMKKSGGGMFSNFSNPFSGFGGGSTATTASKAPTSSSSWFSKKKADPKPSS